MRATRFVTTTLAVALAAGALAGPASAMLPDGPPGVSPAPAASPTAIARPQPGTHAHGLDWGSTGIGAAAGIGAFAIALAGAAGVQRRRDAEHRSLTTD
jgi:hypothetical protein